MQTNFVIDQDATFGGTAKYTLLSFAPKLKFGSDTGEQATTKAGVRQWAGQFLAQYRNQFGNEVAEVLKLTVASENDPSKGIPDMTPVRIEGLTVGVMEGRDGQGFSMFFRAEAITTDASTGPSKAAATVKADDASKAA